MIIGFFQVEFGLYV